MDQINIYTDGAAKGNPGPGGYGIILEYNGIQKEISEGFRLTTNNRMELLAVIVGLEAVKKENATITRQKPRGCILTINQKKNFEMWNRL